MCGSQDVCVQMDRHMGIHACEGQRLMSGIFLNDFLLAFLKQGFIKHGAQWFVHAGWSVSSSDLYVSTFWVLELQMYIDTPYFLYGL